MTGGLLSGLLGGACLELRAGMLGNGRVLHVPRGLYAAERTMDVRLADERRHVEDRRLVRRVKESCRSSPRLHCSLLVWLGHHLVAGAHDCRSATMSLLEPLSLSRPGMPPDDCCPSLSLPVDT
jgi:hypothetical protein